MTKEELEKENAELKEKNKELGDRLCNVANNLLDNWCRNEEDYCPHLAKLEKENAELKESGSVICDRLSERIDETVELKNENIGLKNQLTKAKELLTRCYNNYIYLEPLRSEIEQFLNSEVEK